MTAADEVLAKLIALSAHDLRIRRLTQDLDRAPASLKARKEAIGATDARIAKFEERVNVLKAQMKLRENEVKGYDQKIARLKAQSSEVRTNKEFVAFRSEIANTQGESDRLQNEILKILDVVEQGEAKIAELRQERTEQEAAADEIREQMARQMVEVRKDRDAMQVGRAALLEGIPKEHVETYDRAHRARGNGVAALEGAYCGGCGAQATRNDAYAIQNRTRIVTCKSCNRILYVPGTVPAVD